MTKYLYFLAPPGLRLHLPSCSPPSPWETLTLLLLLSIPNLWRRTMMTKLGERGKRRGGGAGVGAERIAGAEGRGRGQSIGSLAVEGPPVSRLGAQMRM